MSANFGKNAIWYGAICLVFLVGFLCMPIVEPMSMYVSGAARVVAETDDLRQARELGKAVVYHCSEEASGQDFSSEMSLNQVKAAVAAISGQCLARMNRGARIEGLAVLAIFAIPFVLFVRYLYLWLRYGRNERPL